MNFRFNMSAGQFFDLVRPAAIVLAALLSTWVLASARRRFKLYAALAWSLGTLFFPPIVFPLYLIARYRFRKIPSQHSELRYRWLFPAFYLLTVMSFVSLSLYQQNTSVDAQLAKATQARISGDRSASIKYLRRALEIEDNAHTHKLLGIQLVEAGWLTEALGEFRLAEQGGERDDLLPYRIATILDQLNLIGQAKLEYQRFLQTNACTQEPPDRRCTPARARLSAIESQVE